MAATFRPLPGLLLTTLGAGAGLLLLAAALARGLTDLPSLLLEGPPRPLLVVAALGVVLAGGLFGATLGATWGNERRVHPWGAVAGGLAALLVLAANGICVALVSLGAQKAASFALASRPILAAAVFALIATPALLLSLTAGIVCATALGHAGAPGRLQPRGSASIPALFARAYLALLRRPLRGAALGLLAGLPTLVAWTMAGQALLGLSQGLDRQTLGATALAALALALAARFSCALYQVALPPPVPPQRP